MTKRRVLLLLVLLLSAGLLYLLVTRFSQPVSEMYQKKQSGPRKDPVKLEIDGKKVIGLSPGKEREEMEKLVVQNRPSPEWKGELEETLRLQGGNAIKEIKIEPENSFVWSHDGIALYVETAKITVKNQQNELSSFRVMVDAQNGKVLQNWDPPVIDAANIHDQPGLKVDPRYHNR